MATSNAVELQPTLTCPNCGHAKRETMPTNACQFFYECEQCGTMLKPLQGDCCVYCSYGTVPCPPIQQDKSAAIDDCLGLAAVQNSAERGGKAAVTDFGDFDP